MDHQHIATEFELEMIAAFGEDRARFIFDQIRFHCAGNAPNLLRKYAVNPKLSAKETA